MACEPTKPLSLLSSNEVISIERRLQSKSLSSNFATSLCTGIEGVLSHHDAPLIRFRDGYTKMCFAPSVLDEGGFTEGRALLEAGSGNNDLGYFGSLRAFMPPLWGKSNHFLSNYSGGRGDYFALQKLVTIHNHEYLHVTGTPGRYTLENLCMTAGGQGGLSIIASYLKRYHSGSRVVVAESTYCNNYAPFRHMGVGLSFAKTKRDTGLPSVETVIEALSEVDVKAWLYVRFHNPSGEAYSEAELSRIVKELKSRGQFLIYPEAYESLCHNPADSNRYLEILRICQKHGFDGLLRVRTLSKEFGLAGLRAAYLLVPEQIASHGHNSNAVQMFNPPMLNAPILVACSYLRHLSHGGHAIDEIEEYLGTSLSAFHDCHPILADIAMQNEELKANAAYVASELISANATRSDRTMEDDRTFVIMPKGGINMYARLKDFEGVDQDTFFRRAYLLTGLIIQPSSLLGHKQGFWVRFTISHNKDRLAECLRAVRHIRENRELFNLPVPTTQNDSNQRIQTMELY